MNKLLLCLLLMSGVIVGMDRKRPVLSVKIPPSADSVRAEIAQALSDSGVRHSVALNDATRTGLTEQALQLAEYAEMNNVPPKDFFDDCDARVRGSSLDIRLMIAAHLATIAEQEDARGGACVSAIIEVIGEDFPGWIKCRDARHPKGFEETFFDRFRQWQGSKDFSDFVRRSLYKIEQSQRSEERSLQYRE